MNFLDYLKSLFGSSKKSSNSSMDELKDYIEDLKKQNGLAQTPSYERKEPDVMTDEEIKAKAEQELTDYYNQNKNKIEEDYKQKTSAKKDDATSLTDKLDSKLNDLSEDYKEKEKDAHNDSIKQGIARSSIARNTEKQLKEEKNLTETGLKNEYAKKIEDVNEQIEELNRKRQDALNSLNVSYATRLAEKTQKLTEERDKILEEALEYNNKLSQQEYQDRLEAQNNGSALNGDFIKDVYVKADELLSKMDPAEARDAVLNDTVLKEYLNDYYYYKLYDRYA